MKRDLSQETLVIIDKVNETVTASSDITGNVIDLFGKNDIMVYVEATLTAGKIDMLIETADDTGFSINKQEVPVEAIKVFDDKEINKGKTKKELIALTFAEDESKKLKSTFGLGKDILEGRYLRITYKPDGSAAASSKLNSVYVLGKTLCPSNE